MNTKALIAGAVCLVVGAGAGYFGASHQFSEEHEFCTEYSGFFDVYTEIKESYLKDISTLNKTRIEEEMVKGFVSGLDDRFSSYRTNEEEKTLWVNSAPSTVSSGFSVERDYKTKMIKVVTVEDGLQAEKMGLCADDLITAIDGTEVTADNYCDVVEMLLGKDKTHMDLQIRRGSQELAIDFERVNNGEDKSIKINSRMLENNIGYVEFNAFSSFLTGGVGYFTDEMEKLENESELKGLIIDLRKNHGGASTEPIEIFDYFADSGSKTWDEDKNGNISEEMFTTDGVEYEMPVVVLVSGNTYSSAEKLTALFQSTKRGTIVGTQTGGKGVYQDQIPLEDGTAVTLVQGYYYVNDVPNFHEIGITPDIVIDMDEELIGTDKDIQLKKAIELLS